MFELSGEVNLVPVVAVRNTRNVVGDRTMIYVIMYGIAVVGLGITGVVLVMAGWLWYKHQWYAFVDWLDVGELGFGFNYVL